MWFIKEVFYQRKKHYLTMASITISIVLVLLVNIISGYIIENVNLSFEQLGLNISNIQLLESRNDNWIDNLTDIYKIEKYSIYGKKQGKDYKIIGCNSSLSEIFTFNFESGSFLIETGNMYNENQIVIGNRLKTYFNCYKINELINVNGITFRVTGILEKNSGNLYEDFDDCIFVFNEYVSDYNQSGIYFTGGQLPAESYLNELLGKDNYLFINQSQTKKSLISLLKLIRNVLIALSFVSVIVSVIGIVNNSLSNISSRMKEIGIKKSLGASSKDIYLQFIIENIIIFFIGIVFSCLTVFIIVEIINLYVEVKIIIDLSENIKYIVLIIIFGSICNVYPAKKASKITIIETIKKD
ncbi:MAG: ABC transporter permease [Erysipelotrichaceae bacterium]